MRLVALRIAIHGHRHAVVAEHVHDDGRDIGRSRADDFLLVSRVLAQVEPHVPRVQAGSGKIEVEELLGFGAIVRLEIRTQHRLPSGKHRGIARVLKLRLRRIGQAHVHCAANEDHQRDQRAGCQHQNIALDVVFQPAKEIREFHKSPPTVSRTSRNVAAPGNHQSGSEIRITQR